MFSAIGFSIIINLTMPAISFAIAEWELLDEQITTTSGLVCFIKSIYLSDVGTLNSALATYNLLLSRSEIPHKLVLGLS